MIPARSSTLFAQYPHTTCGRSGASFWKDGIGGATQGRPQYPRLLDIYRLRPPWNVAGVDFRVGLQEGIALQDWRTLTSPQVSLNLATGQIYMVGDYVFNNVDFSTGPNGAYIYNPIGQANNISCINCRFGTSYCGADRGSYYITERNSANLILRGCEFDGTYKGQQPSLIHAQQHLDMQYCWTKNSFGGQVVQFDSVGGTCSLIYKYNLIDDSYVLPGAHFNCLQFGAAATVLNAVVQFNTHRQTRLGAAEVWQLYNANTFTSPLLANNTLVARLNYTNLTGPMNVWATLASPCVFTCDGNVTAGQPVILGGFAVPGGFTAGTIYYAVNPVAFTSFQLAAIPGGTAINSTSTGANVTATLVWVGPPQVESAMIHGSNPGETTAGTNNANYFDASGALSSYYTGTMIPSVGWTSLANIDMNTGAPIVPT